MNTEVFLEIAEALDSVRWVAVCPTDAIVPNTGTAVLIGEQQIALFRLADDRVFAISNYDPYSKANVIARGLVGDRNGELKVASPIYKHNFSLITGQSFDDPAVTLHTWPARVVNGCIEIGLSAWKE